LVQNGFTKNFVAFVPQKSALQLRLKMKKTEEVDEIIANSDLYLLRYDNQWRLYCISLKQEDLKKQKDVIMDLFKRTYESYTGSKIEERA